MRLQENDTIFHNWKIKKIIGEGSFGTVYEIEKKEFERTYRAAAKVISIPKNQSDYMYILDEGMTEENVTEYYRSLVDDIIEECDLMERMKGDSHIVSYEDHHVEMMADGLSWTIYIRMELLKPLVTYAKENSFTQKDVIQLGIDICRGLETCQKFNVIHRDIKPENIFVSDAQNYKLGDFGISKVMGRSEMAVSKKGTQVYMAPEVYRGEQYDTTVDIYSLGIVLFRLMNNNRTPFLPPYPAPIRFRDKELALQKRLTGEPIPKPCNASEKFAEVIQKACSFNAKDRYQKPHVMRKVLEVLLEEKIENDSLLEEETNEENRTISVFNSGRNFSVIEEDTRRREEEKERKQAEEEARKNAEEEEKKRLEEVKRKEEEARQKAEEEAKQKAEEDARQKAEEEARQKAEEEARRKAEEEARRKVEEETRRKAEEEARRKAEETRQKAEEETRRKAEEEARQKAEEEARQKAEEEARQKTEEARRKTEEEARQKAEEEARRKAEEARRKAEKEARQKAEEARKKREEAAGSKSQLKLNKDNTYSDIDLDFLEMEPIVCTSVKNGANKKEPAKTVQRQQPYRPVNRNKSKLPFIIAGIAVVISGVGIVIAAFTKVPDIRGMSLENAKIELENAKLSLGSTEYDFSDTVPANCIILQEKESGSHTKKHKLVDVVISKGVPVAQMPNMVNIGYKEAQNNLKGLDLDLIIDVKTVYSATSEAGLICGQVPEVNAELKKGDTVTLYLSQGAGVMPEVIGMSMEEASNTLSAFGITLNTAEVFHDTVPAGQVASQSIAEGEAIGYGMELLLEISKGVEMLTVPEVTGLSESDAVERLTEEGFKKEKIQISYEYNNDIASGIVISQDIAADSQTEKGNVIHLVVSQGKRPVTTNRTSGGSNNSNKKTNNNSGWNWEELD